jgi:hypothetical protein
MENKVKKGFFSTLFDKEQAISDAENYQDIKFYKKSKNILIFLYLAVALVSYNLLPDIAGYDRVDVLVGTLFYLFFLPFIYFNHRWAIVVPCLMYLGDKILFMMDGTANPIFHILFGLVALSLSYQSYVTATHLKKADG